MPELDLHALLERRSFIRVTGTLPHYSEDSLPSDSKTSRKIITDAKREAPFLARRPPPAVVSPPRASSSSSTGADAAFRTAAQDHDLLGAPAPPSLSSLKRANPVYDSDDDDADCDRDFECPPLKRARICVDENYEEDDDDDDDEDDYVVGLCVPEAVESKRRTDAALHEILVSDGDDSSDDDEDGTPLLWTQRVGDDDRADAFGIEPAMLALSEEG